jgi:hypothetical protein
VPTKTRLTKADLIKLLAEEERVQTLRRVLRNADRCIGQLQRYVCDDQTMQLTEGVRSQIKKALKG